MDNNYENVQEAQDNELSNNKEIDMFCRKCGYELHGERFCPNCGTPTTGEINSYNKKKISKVQFIIVAVVALVVIVGLICCFVVIPNIQYNDALQKIETKRYDEAISSLEKLGDYKNAEEKISEAYYKKGVQLEKKQKYKESIKAFENAGNYKDASERKKNVEEEKKLEELKALFKKAYEQCTSDDTTLSSDGMCITVDSKDGSDADGMMDIMTLNGALNMPDSLFTEMCATNSLMGRQSETYDNIEVEWSYHPDNGLDVFFKIEM